jgi:outer membrane biosynthesis protein TonB
MLVSDDEDAPHSHFATCCSSGIAVSGGTVSSNIGGNLMPQLGTPNQTGLSEAQLSQLQAAFENQPADVIRGQYAEVPESILAAAAKKKPKPKPKPKTKPKPKPKPKAKPRPKAKAKSQVV